MMRGLSPSTGAPQPPLTALRGARSSEHASNAYELGSEASVGGLAPIHNIYSPNPVSSYDSHISSYARILAQSCLLIWYGENNYRVHIYHHFILSLGFNAFPARLRATTTTGCDSNPLLRMANTALISQAFVSGDKAAA